MNSPLAETAQLLGQPHAEQPVLFNLPIMTSAGQVSVRSLWERFDQSEYGQHMDTQPPRFTKRYGYEPTAMMRDLGIDVHPRMHQFETAAYVSWLIAAEREAGTIFALNDDDAAVTVFADSIHDMGETTHPAIEAEVGKTVGDIPFGLKTPADRRTEAAVRHSLYRRLYSDVPTSTIERVEALIGHGEDSMAHDASMAAHMLQSYVTAVRARLAFERGMAQLLDFANPETPRETPPAVESLGRLAAGVSANMATHVENHAKLYIFARQIKLATQRAIEQAISGTDQEYARFRHSNSFNLSAPQTRIAILRRN